MKKQFYNSGTKWEPLVGYSRAVRVNNIIYISGTTATDELGNITGIGDPYQQAVQTIKNIEKSLVALGGTLNDVVRTRIYVTDISSWQDIGKAHFEYFGKTMPATSMLEVSRLITPDCLVEIEAEAIVKQM